MHGSRAVIVSVFAALEAADRFLQDTMKIRSGEIEEDCNNNNLNDDMVNSIRTLQ